MSAPELHAKKQKRAEAWEAARVEAAVEARKHAKETRRAIFKKASQYAAEYAQQVSGKRRAAKQCVLCAGRPVHSEQRMKRLPFCGLRLDAFLMAPLWSWLWLLCAGEGPDPAQARGKGCQGLLRGA